MTKSLKKKRIVLIVVLLTALFTYCENKWELKDLIPTSHADEQHQEREYDYSIKVIGISDGDTFTGLTQDNIEIRFRIYAIDAPEKKQAFGEKSKQYLSNLIYNKRVGIVVQKKNDGYGRPVVWVYTPDGKDVSAEMLKEGMAWHFKKYDKSEEYAALESSARIKQVGLWKDKNPVAPWDFRKNKTTGKNSK
ncbi:MAG: thermonuclease family protein [Bacteroidales bacterium]|nr:thermonuclease family protein [Bacteroidales bacterium]